MAGIFISYRQADAKAWAISLRDDLARAFGEDQVFLDKDTLHAGNWKDQIRLALDRCTVVLVVIGSRWLTVEDEQGRPRIGLAGDVHRQEITLALERADVTVIPVLVDDAPMPRVAQLPKDLHKLCDQQAYKIGDTQARRTVDLGVLIKTIQDVGGLAVLSRNNIHTQRMSSTDQSSWVRLDVASLVIAVVLAVCSAMFAYLSNAPLGNGEIFFLLLMLYALTFGVKHLWHLRANRKRRAA